MNGKSKLPSVSNRFVSQTDLDEQQKKRIEKVKEEYAKLGKEVTEEILAEIKGESSTYDPRTLYERLQSQKEAKQELIDEKLKLSNQFRGIDNEESEFLAQIEKSKKLNDQKRKEEIEIELEEFKRKRAKIISSSDNIAKLKFNSNNQKEQQQDKLNDNTLPPNRSKRKKSNILGIVKKK